MKFRGMKLKVVDGLDPSGFVLEIPLEDVFDDPRTRDLVLGADFPDGFPASALLDLAAMSPEEAELCLESMGVGRPTLLEKGRHTDSKTGRRKTGK